MRQIAHQRIAIRHLGKSHFHPAGAVQRQQIILTRIVKHQVVVLIIEGQVIIHQRQIGIAVATVIGFLGQLFIINNLCRQVGYIG